MTATYTRTSPWYTTKIVNNYLDTLTIRQIPAADSDVKYSIGSQYDHRPDLLAYDLYGDAALWWVFAQRNMDVLKDPVYDFETGTVISIPKKTDLLRYLGL
jgi:hypothetical protein